ncbi:MAG: hypothetical protein ACOYB8_04050 [Eubacteriaceae bacterium]
MTTLEISVICTVFWIGLHFGTAWLFCFIPAYKSRKLFDYRRAYFTVSEREMKFYRSIGLPLWKDQLPQYNHDFNKRKLSQKPTIAYMQEFLYNTCRAEVIHETIAVLGFSSLLLCLLCEKPSENIPLFLTIAVVIGLCNLPFSMIQRYNRYRLARVLNRMINKKREYRRQDDRKQQSETSDD